MSKPPQRKRPRERLDCPSCGVNFSKSSYYEHMVECSRKYPDLEDSDSSFEAPEQSHYHSDVTTLSGII